MPEESWREDMVIFETKFLIDIQCVEYGHVSLPDFRASRIYAMAGVIVDRHDFIDIK